MPRVESGTRLVLVAALLPSKMDDHRTIKLKTRYGMGFALISYLVFASFYIVQVHHSQNSERKSQINVYIFSAALINVGVDLFMISPVMSFFKTYALPRIAARVLRDYLPADVKRRHSSSSSSSSSATTPTAAPSRRRVTSVVVAAEEPPAAAAAPRRQLRAFLQKCVAACENIRERVRNGNRSAAGIDSGTVGNPMRDGGGVEMNASGGEGAGRGGGQHASLRTVATGVVAANRFAGGARAASLPLPDRQDGHPSLKAVATGVIAVNRFASGARAASLPLPDREDRHPSLRAVATGVIAANRLEGSARGETAEV